MNRTFEYYGLLILEFYMFLIAVPSGIIFVIDPTGSVFDAEILLSYLPFTDFLFVGLWLLFVFGLLSLLIMIGIIFQYRLAWISALFLAILQLIWIGIQYVIFYGLGINPFMIIIPITALMTIILLFRPQIKENYYKKGKISIRALNI